MILARERPSDTFESASSRRNCNDVPDDETLFYRRISYYISMAANRSRVLCYCAMSKVETSTAAPLFRSRGISLRDIIFTSSLFFVLRLPNQMSAKDANFLSKTRESWVISHESFIKDQRLLQTPVRINNIWDLTLCVITKLSIAIFVLRFDAFQLDLFQWMTVFFLIFYDYIRYRCANDTADNVRVHCTRDD